MCGFTRNRFWSLPVNSVQVHFVSSLFHRWFFNFAVEIKQNSVNVKLNIVHLPHNVHKVLAEVSGLRALIVDQSEAEKCLGFGTAALQARRKCESEMKLISRLKAEKLKWCKWKKEKRITIFRCAFSYAPSRAIYYSKQKLLLMYTTALWRSNNIHILQDIRSFQGFFFWGGGCFSNYIKKKSVVHWMFSQEKRHLNCNIYQ